MSSVLIEALKLPDSCRIDKRVFKKLFLENARLAPQDRRAFTNDVEEVVWRHTLKPSTMAIMPYEDTEHEYTEIAVLEVSLSSPRNAARVAEVAHRGIPYPLILAMSSGQRELLSLAPKRLSRSEIGAVVVEEFVHTGWLQSDIPTETEADFVASLALRHQRQPSLLGLYWSYVSRLIALEVAQETGCYAIPSVAGTRTCMSQLRLLRQSMREAKAARAALARETQFARRVELSAEIQEFESEARALRESLTQGK